MFLLIGTSFNKFSISYSCSVCVVSKCHHQAGSRRLGTRTAYSVFTLEHLCKWSNPMLRFSGEVCHRNANTFPTLTGLAHKESCPCNLGITPRYAPRGGGRTPTVYLTNNVEASEQLARNKHKTLACVASTSNNVDAGPLPAHSKHKTLACVDPPSQRRTCSSTPVG
jgi:hypothetical protein